MKEIKKAQIGIFMMVISGAFLLFGFVYEMNEADEQIKQLEQQVYYLQSENEDLEEELNAVRADYHAVIDNHWHDIKHQERERVEP